LAANRVGYFIPARIRNEETRRQRGNKFSLGSTQGTYSTSNAFQRPTVEGNSSLDDAGRGAKTNDRYKSHFTIDHPRAASDVYGGVTVNGRFHNENMFTGSEASLQASRAQQEVKEKCQKQNIDMQLHSFDDQFVSSNMETQHRVDVNNHESPE
jgi:hypothetical protein